MSVTVDDILKIKPGETESFLCADPLEARSGQSLALNYVGKFKRPAGVLRYKTRIRDEKVLQVTAIASE